MKDHHYLMIAGLAILGWYLFIHKRPSGATTP